ncbi:2S seed storage albumin protein-like isoform X2 [Rhodamnia argentea]|uniref:2S seed storage albumin protein-like isoform X2 n=1 Tax=Rhodamnia argentea TaxID=178133 RepID=A0A8B8NJH9_9MYRT|nr:2S seed storage albumin protein-like isoform X2 [Rhodamnia argentea]
MARVAVSAAVLALLFVAASATYRTTITTVEFDDEANPGLRGGSGRGSQQCRQRVSTQQLHQCEQYITQGRGYIVLPRHEGGQKSLDQCCQQLKKMDPQCRCEGLRQIVQERQQRGQHQGQELREMVQRAQNLPNACGLGTQHCDIGSYGGGRGY